MVAGGVEGHHGGCRGSQGHVVLAVSAAPLAPQHRDLRVVDAKSLCHVLSKGSAEFRQLSKRCSLQTLSRKLELRFSGCRIPRCRGWSQER